MGDFHKHVMLIDDDDVNNYINRKKLIRFRKGFDIVTFIKAEDALRYLTEGDNTKPDVIFLDINMPTMTGWEFLDVYEPMQLAIPVVMLTSSIAKTDREKATKYATVQGYWMKPLSDDNLKKFFP